jgi:Sec-independent protein translocase protein TatA
MDGLCAAIVKLCQVVLVLAWPALLYGAVRGAGRGARAVRRRVSDRRAELNPQPANRPIEQIAADLRRLLSQHDTLTQVNDPMGGRRLWAVEAAITDCAMQAARALGVSHPDRPAYARFGTARLRRLLRALAAEGLALPPAAGLLAPDRS